jgi:hypothetical protein
MDHRDRVRQRCNWLLTSLVGAKLVDQWWTSPNLHWNGQTPESIFQLYPDEVYDYLLYYAMK